jgi:2-desacetyl-2-hydroxyethyl bacteriochlorophyllide A dehydrogenase
MEELSMKALVKYGSGSEFGGYKYEDVPVPTLSDEDILVELKASAICGADLKHFGVENGSTVFDSVRGHEFAGEIVEVGKKVTDWKVGDRVVSDNTGYVCGKCHACDAGDFLLCPEKKNLGLGLDGGFTKYVKIPGQILRIHKHSIFKVPDNISYEEAAILDPICNAYKAIAQRSNLLPGQDVVIFGAGPLGLFSVQIARVMGAANIIVVGLEDDTKVRFDVAKKLGATHIINAEKEDVVARVREIEGRDGLGLVVDCAGAPIVLKQSIEMLRTNGQFVRIGMGFKPLEYSINDISMKAITITGHMAYDTSTWKNCINLLQRGMIDSKSLITHRLPLSQWEEGFKLMMGRDAIKVILTYDGD